MKKNIQAKIQLFFASEKISLFAITVFAMIYFYIWMTINAVFIFQQFTILEIVSVSLAFFALFLILWILFYNDFFQHKVQINIQNIVISFFIFIFMIFLSNSTAIVLDSYYHVFPLLDTELGLGWHKDTAFHVSVIQSILNNGYPSIGQHGSPILVYHVLSHYMDAFLLYLTGLEPYDSVGLLFYFKKFILIATIVAFISYISKEVKIYIFLISLFLISPIIIGTWHAIGSHGLWFTSILLIFSSPLIFKIITKYDENSIKDFILMFILIALISFGKVSTGFMFASFIGFYLLLKQPKNKHVYFFGVGMILFFLTYKKLMSYNNSGKVGLDFSWINIDSIYHHLTSSYPMQTQIFDTLFLMVFLAFIFKNSINFRFALALVISYIVLVVITKTNTVFNSNDTWYFYYGLSSVLILFLIQNIVRNIHMYKSNKSDSLSIVDQKLLILGLLFSSIYWSNFYISPTINKNIKPRTQIDAKFMKTNSKLESKDKFSYRNRIKKPFDNLMPTTTNRPLFEFRNSLNNFLTSSGIPKQDTSLYISKEIFQKYFPKFKGDEWARGMLIYSITGASLVNGVQNLRGNYGYADYNQHNFWINKENFQPEQACATISSKFIVIINSFEAPEFTLYKCKGK